MRKNYFNLNVLALAVALLLVGVGTATAQEQAYCWWYTRAMTYPEDAGKVCTQVISETAEPVYKTVSDYKYSTLYYKGYANKYFYFYAQPEDGYVFLGWKKLDNKYWVELETNPNASVKDFLSAEFESNDAACSMYLETTQYSDKETDENYSKYPDNTYVAVFGYFGLKYIPGQESLGTMFVEEPEVEIGGSTQVEATPAEGAEFLYWVDEEGNKVSDENPYTVEVTRSCFLRPMFSAPGYLTIDFGKGRYQLMSNSKYTMYVPANCWFYMLTPLVENTYVYGGEVHTYTAMYNHFADSTAHVVGAYERGYALYQGNAGLFYGEGLGTFRLESVENPSVISENMLKATGSETVDIAKLSHEGVKYYVFDGKNKFVQTGDAVLPPDSAYLAIKSDFEAYKFSEFTVMSRDEYKAFMEKRGGKTVYLTAERKTGLGGTVTEIAYDEAAVLKTLGIDKVDEDNVFPVNVTTGEVVKDWKKYDGWFDANGDVTDLSSSKRQPYARLQYPHDGKLLLSTFADNDPVDGSGFMTEWAICSATDTVVLHVDVSFMQHETVKFEICDSMVKTGTTYYTMSENFGEDYEGEEDPYIYDNYMEHSIVLTDAQVEFVKSQLGIDDIAEAQIMGYNPLGEKLVSLADVQAYDGWRNAYGNFTNHTGNIAAPICVKVVDATHYLTYNIAEVTTGKYKAYWALTTNTKAVLIEFTLTFVHSLPTAISSVEADVAESDVTYDLAGRRVSKVTAPGVYIRGGKKYLVK